MRLPEGFQDFFIRYHLGIKFDLDYLGVAGASAANLLVSGIRRRAAGVTAGNRSNSERLGARPPGQHLKDRLGAPETTAAERRRFSRLICLFHKLGLGEPSSQAAGQHDGGQQNA